MIVHKILLNYEPKRHNLLPAIKEINKQKNFFSVDDARRVSAYFKIPEAEVFSAASFYDEINVKKPAIAVVQFCDSPNCQVKNVEKIIKEIETLYRQKTGDDFNAKLKIERISCQGRCLDGPIMIVNGNIYEKVDSGKAIEIIQRYIQ